jgi:hypothetical protein
MNRRMTDIRMRILFDIKIEIESEVQKQKKLFFTKWYIVPREMFLTN